MFSRMERLPLGTSYAIGHRTIGLLFGEHYSFVVVSRAYPVFATLGFAGLIGDLVSGPPGTGVSAILTNACTQNKKCVVLAPIEV